MYQLATLSCKRTIAPMHCKLAVCKSYSGNATFDYASNAPGETGQAYASQAPGYAGVPDLISKPYEKDNANYFSLIGHIGRDPEYRQLASGDGVATMTLAVRRGKEKPDDWCGHLIHDCFAQIYDEHLAIIHRHVDVTNRCVARVWRGLSLLQLRAAARNLVLVACKRDFVVCDMFRCCTVCDGRALYFSPWCFGVFRHSVVVPCFFLLFSVCRPPVSL